MTATQQVTFDRMSQKSVTQRVTKLLKSQKNTRFSANGNSGLAEALKGAYSVSCLERWGSGGMYQKNEKRRNTLTKSEGSLFVLELDLPNK